MPQTLQSRVELHGKTAPVLYLLESLRDQGWRPVDAVIRHTVESRDSSVKDVTHRRVYLQVLLRWAELSVVVAGAKSDAPVAFGSCVLVGLRVPLVMRANEYKAALRDEDEAAPLEAQPLEAVQDAQRGAIVDEELVQDVVAIADDVASDVGDAEAEPSVTGVISDSNTSNESSSTSESSESVVQDDGGFAWPAEVDGCPLRFEDALRKHGYQRLVLRCAWHGPDCSRKRNTGPRQRSLLGQLEPLAYLAAWNAMGQGITKEQHMRRTQPSLAAQRAWLVERGHL